MKWDWSQFGKVQTAGSVFRLFRLAEIKVIEAQKIVDQINQIKIPIIAEVDGFVRVQAIHLKSWEQTLVVLYHKKPDKQLDVDLAKWIGYKNISRFKTDILQDLHRKALIHYEGGGYCTLLPKGVLFVEQNIPLDLTM